MGPLALQCLTNGVLYYNLNVVSSSVCFVFFFCRLFFHCCQLLSVLSVLLSLASTQEIQECLEEYIALENAYLTDIDRNFGKCL